MGGGPIDFKFSSGYSARVLVEMKRSGGTVVHGYEKQLEFYKDASQTEFALFVIMDYGDLDTKLNEIRRIQNARLDAGGQAAENHCDRCDPKGVGKQAALNPAMILHSQRQARRALSLLHGHKSNFVDSFR